MEQGKDKDKNSREVKEDMEPTEENNSTRNGKEEDNSIHNEEPDAVEGKVDHGKEKDFSIEDVGEKDSRIMQVGKCQVKLDQKSEEEKLESKGKLESDYHSDKESKEDKNQEDNSFVPATITGETRSTQQECKGATEEEKVGHQNEYQMDVNQGVEYEKTTKLLKLTEGEEQDIEDGLKNMENVMKPMNKEGIQCSTKNMKAINHEAGHQENGEDEIEAQTDMDEENVRDKSRNHNLEMNAESLENAKELENQKSKADMESQDNGEELENQKSIADMESQDNGDELENQKSKADMESQDNGEELENQKSIADMESQDNGEELENQKSIADMESQDNGEELENQKSIADMESQDNGEELENQKSIADMESQDNGEELENQKSIADMESQDNGEELENQKSIADMESQDNGEELENQKSIADMESQDNGEELENQKSIADMESQDNGEELENQKSIADMESQDNGEELENQKSIADMESQDNGEELENQKSIADMESQDNGEELENQKSIADMESQDNGEELENQKSIADMESKDNGEELENQKSIADMESQDNGDELENQKSIADMESQDNGEELENLKSIADMESQDNGEELENQKSIADMESQDNGEELENQKSIADMESQDNGEELENQKSIADMESQDNGEELENLKSIADMESQDNGEELENQKSIADMESQDNGEELENQKSIADMESQDNGEELENQKSIADMESQDNGEELENQKSIADMESHENAIELEKQKQKSLEVENKQNKNSVETQQNVRRGVENQEKLGEKVEHRKKEDLKVQPFTNLEQKDLEEGIEKHQNMNQDMECQKNIKNGSRNKKCMKQNFELKKDISKGFKCAKEGTPQCKHIFKYSKDAEQEVDNNVKQKVEDSKIGLEKSLGAEREVETSQDHCVQLDKHLHTDPDLMESQEGTQNSCDEGKKSPVLGRKCVKIFFTSNKEGYKGSDCLSGNESELANVSIGEGSISEEKSQINTNNIDGESVVAICLEDKNLVESTSKDDTKLCGPIVRQFKYQPGQGTEESIGFQSPKSESGTYAVVNRASVNKRNIIITSSERESAIRGIPTCPLHGNPPRILQSKIEKSEKIVECIDLLSDDEDNNATLKSATGTKPLQSMPKIIVPEICEKCRNIWNNNVLSAIFLGTDSVTVNSKITYGAIICINNWADSHYLSGKETAVRSLLERADLGKNIGSLKISEVNHWLGSLMKAGKVKCCDVFEAFYKPEANYKLLATLSDIDVSTNKAMESTRMITPEDSRKNAPMQMRENDVVEINKNKQKKSPSQSPKNISSSLKNPSPSGSEHILASPSGSGHILASPSGSEHTLAPPSGSEHILAPPSGSEHILASPSGSEHSLAPPSGSEHILAPPSGSEHILAPPSGSEHILASPSGSEHILVSCNDSDSTSEKIRLSGAWDTPMFDGTGILIDKEQKCSAVCSDKQKMVSFGNVEECASKNGQVLNNEKSSKNQIVQSVSEMGKSSCSKQSSQSSPGPKTMPMLTFEEETLPISKKVVSSVSKKRISDVLTADFPRALRNKKSPGSKKMRPTLSKSTSPIVCDKITSSSTEKTVASTSKTNETLSSMNSSELDTPTTDTVTQKVLDASTSSSTSHPISTVRTTLTLSPSTSSNSFSEELKSTSGEQKSTTPKVRPSKVLRSKRRQNVEASTRKASSLLHSSHALPPQDATVTSSDMSSQQSKCDPAVSNPVADNLTRRHLRTSCKKVAYIDEDTSTSQTVSMVSSTQEVSSGKTSPVQSEHESEQESIFNKEQLCSQGQQKISIASSLQNSSKTSVHHVDENSISSDSGGGGDEDNVAVSSAENSYSTLCSVLGLNVSTLDTYSSSTDMKTITNGDMSKNPSKKYKFSFSHYAMLKERSALSGLAREAFDLMPFESDNCRPLTHSTVGRERFLTNRELLTLQNICILHPENPDVDLFFRILVQILLTRNRVLLVPNSLTLLLVAENLRREFNRAKSKGTYAVFLSQDWDMSNVYTAEDLWLSKLEHIKEPTIRNVITVFCLWKNLDKHIPNISLPEALQDMCKNIDLAATDKTKLCIKLYARFCRYLYEEKNNSLAEFFLNQPFTGCNTPTSRKVLINTMVTKLSSDILSLSSNGSLEIAEKEVQSALQKCLASEKAVLDSHNVRKEEELRLNITMFKEKFDRYKEVNNLLVRRIQVVEKDKQEVLTKIVDSKSKRLVKEFSQTLTAIHQSLAKRKKDNYMDMENSRKALKQNNSTGIHSSVESCSRDRFSNTAASIDIGEDVPQIIREGIYELLASEVDVGQVRTVIHIIMSKMVGEEALRLPSDSWIRNFARLNGFIMKSK